MLTALARASLALREASRIQPAQATEEYDEFVDIQPFPGDPTNAGDRANAEALAAAGYMVLLPSEDEFDQAINVYDAGLADHAPPGFMQTPDGQYVMRGMIEVDAEPPTLYDPILLLPNLSGIHNWRRALIPIVYQRMGGGSYAGYYDGQCQVLRVGSYALLYFYTSDVGGAGIRRIPLDGMVLTFGVDS